MELEVAELIASSGSTQYAIAEFPQGANLCRKRQVFTKKPGFSSSGVLYQIIYFIICQVSGSHIIGK